MKGDINIDLEEIQNILLIRVFIAVIGYHGQMEGFISAYTFTLQFIIK